MVKRYVQAVYMRLMLLIAGRWLGVPVGLHVANVDLDGL